MILPLEYVQKCELSLVKKGVEIWNIIEDFFVKIEELSIEGGWHSFSLVMYGFCSNSALYSASLSCIIFILLTSFISKIITISFQSNRSLVMLIEKILTKKKSIQCCFNAFKTWKNNFPSRVCICAYVI